MEIESDTKPKLLESHHTDEEGNGIGDGEGEQKDSVKGQERRRKSARSLSDLLRSLIPGPERHSQLARLS